MVTRDGHAKILDFGLAKLIEPQGMSGQRCDEFSEVATALMQHHSTPGAVLGTVGYMSPEQAQGRVQEIDHRSDIFSFGCLLFEAATRHRPFEGKDALDPLHNIVHAPTPQIKDFNAEAPDELQKIVRRCLAKDPDERYHSIKDVAIELRDVRRDLQSAEQHTTAPPFTSREMSQPSGEAVATQTATTSTAPGSLSTHPSSAEYIVTGITRHKSAVALTLAALVVVAVAAVYAIYKFAAQKTAIISFQSAKFTRLTTTGKVTIAAISPDGKWLVHVMDEGGQQSLWLRQVAVANSNTQVVAPAEVHYAGLAFSPDGNYVYYTMFESNSSTGMLYQVPVLGGSARKLISGISGPPVAFSPDGKRMAFFVYDVSQSEDQIMISNVDGTGARKLVGRHGNEFFIFGTFSKVAWLPDGKTIVSPAGNSTENYQSVVAISVENGETKFFCPKRWQMAPQVAWLDNRHGLLVTARERISDNFSIWQVSYPSGEAQKITNDLNSYPSVSVTSDGKLLAAVQTEQYANIWVIAGTDSARAIQITQGRQYNGAPSWTPDGEVVHTSWSGGNYDLYLIDSRGGSAKQLTANSGSNIAPSVSPDGRYIVFTSDRAGMPNIWRMDIDGANPKRLIDKYSFAPDVSPDGRWVAYMYFANKYTIWRVGIDGGQPVQLTDSNSVAPAFSPDGKQIACVYQEDSNAPFKLALLPFAGGPPSRLLPLPGVANTRLRWMPDGSAIVYGSTRNGVTNLWAQPVDGSPAKQLTNFTADRIFAFDFSRDGKQLALSRGTISNDVVLISDFK